MLQKLRISALALLLAGATLPAMAQVKVGTNPAVLTPSATFEVESTTGGLLPPRMTVVQMTAIAVPATGLMVWCTNCSPVGLRIFDGTVWSIFGTSGAPNATYTGGTIACGVAPTGTFYQNKPTDATNNKQVTISAASTGSYTMTTNTSNGIYFSTSGEFTSTGSKTVTLTATGTPLVAGSFSYIVSASGQSCTFNISVSPVAVFACDTATSTFTPGILTSSSAHSGTYTLAYKNGNSQPYPTTTVTQNGITMTRTAGTYIAGGGDIVYTFGGNHTGTNTSETFSLDEGCSVKVGCYNKIGTTGGPIVQMLYDNDGYDIKGAAIKKQYSWCAREVSIAIPAAGTTPSSTQVWLDRNLGADSVAASSTDIQAYGSYYQWGRRADGHQRLIISDRGGIDIGIGPRGGPVSNVSQPANGTSISTDNSGTSGDWRSPANDSMWSGLNGVNNPCPSGFRLPTQTEFTTLSTGWTTTTAVASSMAGIKMPLAGIYDPNSNILNPAGTDGYYWSSTPQSTNARFFTFSASNFYVQSAWRSTRMSVRCIKN